MLYIHEAGIDPVGFIYLRFFFFYHLCALIAVIKQRDERDERPAEACWKIKVWVEHPGDSLRPVPLRLSSILES